MAFLGFSAGLPFPLVFTTLTAWLRTEGVERTAIGMFAWVGLLYSIKFFWAPLVDRLRLPLITDVLGRRRSWMLAAQLGILLALTGLAACDPSANLTAVALLAVAVAFCSATQDIAIDAYRIEAVEVERQGAMAASYQLGYRIAVLAGTAGALYLADFYSWSLAYTVMALAMSVGLVTVMIIREPAVQDREGREGSTEPRAADWLRQAILGPFVEFFKRNGRFAFLLLGFVALSRVSDLLLGIMANPFYLDIGYSMSQIATVAKVFGFTVTMVGAILGGVIVGRYGPTRPLVTAAVLLSATNLCFAALASYGLPDVSLLAVTISADNFALGFASTVFIAYLSSLTNAAYTATQYALFSSLMVLPGKLLSGFSGAIVDATDYVTFFLYASAMGVPAIVLAVIISRRASSSAGA